MSRQVKLENKQIIVGSNEYRLTIIKEQRYAFGTRLVYAAYLSDINSQFTINKTFTNIRDMEKGLRAWIIKADKLNNPEIRVFEKLREWDGVIGI